MERRRVLHVIGGLELGGAETLLYRLATHASSGFEHEIVCLGPPGWYSSRLLDQGIPVEHLGMTSLASSAAGLRRLREVIRSRRPDVVHCWMYLANVLGGIAARGSGPVVWSIHASTFEHLGTASRVCAHVGGRTVRQLADFVINCSAHSARRHARFGYGAVEGAVIPNGYDSSCFFPDETARRRTRAELGLREREFAIGTIARWHSEKDVPLLLRAFASIPRSAVEARCVLIGPGLDRSNAELMRIVGGRALPLGRRDDVPDLTRALDLHVLSSRSEAFPNVIGETMLSGTPNVVTDVGDSALMVGDTGWVVPRDSERMALAMHEALVEWQDRPEEWRQRQHAARNRIVERYSFEAMVAAYQEVWNKVARRH